MEKIYSPEKCRQLLIRCFRNKGVGAYFLFKNETINQQIIKENKEYEYDKI